MNKDGQGRPRPLARHLHQIAPQSGSLARCTAKSSSASVLAALIFATGGAKPQNRREFGIGADRFPLCGQIPYENFEKFQNFGTCRKKRATIQSKLIRRSSLTF